MSGEPEEKAPLQEGRRKAAPLLLILVPIAIGLALVVVVLAVIFGPASKERAGGVAPGRSDSGPSSEAVIMIADDDATSDDIDDKEAQGDSKGSGERESKPPTLREEVERDEHKGSTRSLRTPGEDARQ